MHIRRVARFRARRGEGWSAAAWRRVQLHGGATLLVLAVLAISAVLVAAPTYWAFNRADALNLAWAEPLFEDISRVEEHWTSLPHLSPFRRGDETHVKEFLREQPLVLAVLNRVETRTIWVRQGERFVLAQENPDTQMFRRWFTKAEETQRFLWVPPEHENPEARITPSVVLKGDQWLVLKRWQPGSEAVENALRNLLGSQPRFRVGLRLQPFHPPPGALREAWGEEPRLQVDPVGTLRYWFGQQLTSNAFEGWEICVVPLDADERAMRRKVRQQFLLGSSASALVGISLLLGLWLRYRARKKSLLDADRLASLTHSLKTPLAILKVRCDSIRLGRLDPEQTDLELMRLGEEVDHLSLVIENGLQAIRGVEQSSTTAVLGAAWFEDLVEDLRPAFDAEGRTLVLSLSPDRGRASQSSLRAALLTLLENALYHGDGSVLLETFRQRNRLVIRVSDQGAGLEPHQLDVLGKPFQRLRQEGKEGFRHEGTGLGVSLLCQVAEREGWGLTFASAPSQGFTATLEVAAV